MELMDYEFFDCNAFIGRPARRDVYPAAPDAETILAEMDFCGVSRALVWHIAQFDASPHLGNELLAQRIAGHERLAGCWALLPNQTREFPPFDQFLATMRQARVTSGFARS